MFDTGDVQTLYGPHRKTHTDEPTTRIVATGKDYYEARAALYAQVPEGHSLLFIMVGDPPAED